MAKYTVTRACGHDEVVSLVGKNSDREWRLENVEPYKLCYECYQKELAVQREKENRESAEAAREMQLPHLTGSEKQIAWAETVRQELIARFEREIYDVRRRGEAVSLKAVEALESIKTTKTEARWWIDHRHLNASGMSYEIEELLSKEYEAINSERSTPPEVVADAKIEATVRPENPVTETVAEIRALEGAVEISFPEKRDDFRETVKGMGFKWDNGCWRRKLFIKNGTPQDRAAEAGHRLLAKGFIIRIYDETIRAKAISGDYEQECTNWIQKRDNDKLDKGKYNGWLAISWGRDDDLYRAAKRIKGARWSNPSVVVPPENFEEVLDFAKMYGFKISEFAQAVIDAARQVKEAALTARVEPPKEPERITVSSKPPVLEVPAEVGIADEFKD